MLNRNRGAGNSHLHSSLGNLKPAYNSTHRQRLGPSRFPVLPLVSCSRPLFDCSLVLISCSICFRRYLLASFSRTPSRCQDTTSTTLNTPQASLASRVSATAPRTWARARRQGQGAMADTRRRCIDRTRCSRSRPATSATAHPSPKYLDQTDTMPVLTPTHPRPFFPSPTTTIAALPRPPCHTPSSPPPAPPTATRSSSGSPSPPSPSSSPSRTTPSPRARPSGGAN